MHPLLGPRFEAGLIYATEAHREQTRKATSVPYISHLLAVAALVLEHGGDEDQAIAALLHDAPEDQGGIERLADIRAKFGDRVADLVAGCSEPPELAGHPWLERKTAYLAHLREVDESALLIVCADKLHNVRSILGELPTSGIDIFSRFGGQLEGSLWYYRALSEALSELAAPSLARLLTDEVEQMELRVHALNESPQETGSGST